MGSESKLLTGGLMLLTVRDLWKSYPGQPPERAVRLGGDRPVVGLAARAELHEPDDRDGVPVEWVEHVPLGGAEGHDADGTSSR